MLAKVLLALALRYERDAEVSLPIGANVLRVVDDDGARLRDLPRLSGVSKESVAMAIGFLCNRDCTVVETQNRVKHVRLTERGRRAKHGCATRLSKVEDAWRDRFGAATIDELAKALESIAGPPDAPQQRLFEGLEAHPENWRAKVAWPQTLPYYSMVLHRGGYPDGN